MTTATTTAIQTVSANIDERRFLGNLQTMFSTTSTFLGELMQNARRSGSPQIRFDYESNESTLEVTDSGCGIDCYQTLITIAKSGWDEKVMVDDRPFGMGFASVIFAGKGGVEVASHGKQICFTADDFIEKRPIQIQTSDFSGGTRVRIKGMHLAADSVDKSLRRMAKGFAIDVLWNGDLLPRPYEQTSITGEMTAVGYIHIPYIHDSQCRNQEHEWNDNVTNTNGRWFLQGLPCNNTYTTSISPVIHLDGKQFIPRMPDRDALLDEANAKERIALAVNSIWKRFLESEKLRLSGEQFAETYWQIASKVEGSFTLMNDVEWLPSTSLEVISDYPITRSESDCNYWSRSKSGVSKEAITSGAITLFDNDFYERDEGDHFAKLLWAKDTDAVFLSGHLPEGHWAKNHVVSLQQVDAEISFKEIKQTNWDGHYACGNVILVNSLSVTILGKTQYLQEPFVRYGTYSDFIVPEDALEPFWVLRQASSYTDGNDNYAELEHELDIEDFSAMVAILKGEDSEVTLIRLLKDARLFSNLNDRAFLVCFGKDGKVTVTPQ